MNMILSIVLIIVGLILLIIPIYELIIACKSASDITWTLGQKGGMRNGLIFYICCAIIGACLITWGSINLIS